MIKIYYSSNFASKYKKLSNRVKLEGRKKEKLFRKNPFDPKLQTHKLTGKLKGLWAFSIDYKHRIILEFKGENVRFHTVGTHDIYRNQF